MLKIKDNVDLKELEKYGFFDGRDGFEAILQDDQVLVINGDKTLFISPCMYCGNIFELSLIYDLIKDGLVEKVDDSNE